MVSRLPKPPPIDRVRFANVDDANAILEMVNVPVSEIFRVKCANDIIYLIENGIISICQLNAYGDIIGFICARDYPMIPSVHPATWEHYIWTKFKTTEIKARNTLFLHLLCWNPMYTRETVDNMLKSIFMHDPYIHHIAMVKCVVKYPLLVPGQSRSEASFRKVQAMERGVTGDRLPALYIADRIEVCPRLRIRRAVEEDNDDLVPIIENHSKRLQEMYGEFYISELIARHPESDRVLIVCEHQDQQLAVGMMCLNTTVNYEDLEENFVLAPFAGLRHLDTQWQTEPYELEKRSTDLDLSAISLVQSVASDTGIAQSVDGKQEKTNRSPDSESEWQEKTNRSPDSESEKSEVSIEIDSHSLIEDVMGLLLDDEQSALDYDIVNIDTQLLRVPEVLYSRLSRCSAPGTPPKSTKDKTKMHQECDEKSKKKKVKKANIGDLQPEPVRYSGAPNAFLIELFAMHPSFDERYGFDMLEAAYELFPDRDYCILSLPTNITPFPLLEHFTLVTPIGSRLKYINESLYVAHVNSVQGNVRVRYGENCDMDPLQAILENAFRRDTIQELFQSTLGSKSLESYMFLSENQPIGMVVIGPLEEASEIRAQYDLDPLPRRPGTDGVILAGVISPALEPHARWFLREILRQSRYATLFWICRLFQKSNTSSNKNLMSFAAQMNPVHLRQLVPNISGNKELDRMYKNLASPFTLWMLERPLTSLPKVYVNKSIVVVGASRTGLAFIESLLMGPASQYLTFSNLTLVSEHGLPTVVDCLKAADICIPQDGRFTDRYIKSVPFYFYVDVIPAVMVAIDRKRKYIRFKNGHTKYYDELVLTCGQQFQHPEYLKDALELVKEVEKGKPCDRILMDNPKYKEERVPPPPELPSNVYLINSLFEANINLRKLMRRISDTKDVRKAICEKNPVVVYGDCTEAYSCVAALLELGLQSKMIVFVEPFPSLEPTALRVNCFNDELIDQRVQAKLDSLGIRVLRQCHLASWQLDNNTVESLNLITPFHSINIKCFTLFYFGLRAIDLYAFKAINESGLVYDGGLVVSPTFETNDPSIYGAGTCISYSRKLYATRGLHRNFCSEDIGEALARLFLVRLDPYVMGDPDVGVPSDLLTKCTSSALGFKSQTQILTGSCSQMRIESLNRRWQPVMQFKSPIAQYVTLPGPLYYLKIRRAGKDIPMAVQKMLPHQGHTLVTDKNSNYFRVQLNAVHVVDAVTCLSNEPFSGQLMTKLYGRHEAVFNKLLTRYLKHEIDDFYEYFTQPWMSALYQETMNDLMNDIHEQDVGMVYDLVKSKFALFDDTMDEDDIFAAASAPSGLARMSTTSEQRSSIGLSTREIRQMGNFPTMIERYIYEKDSKVECGQNRKRHKGALKFWDRISGDRIMSAHLAKYLDANSITHPHYAKPKEEYSSKASCKSTIQ